MTQTPQILSRWKVFLGTVELFLLLCQDIVLVHLSGMWLGRHSSLMCSPSPQIAFISSHLSGGSILCSSMWFICPPCMANLDCQLDWTQKQLTGTPFGVSVREFATGISSGEKMPLQSGWLLPRHGPSRLRSKDRAGEHQPHCSTCHTSRHENPASPTFQLRLKVSGSLGCLQAPNTRLGL